MQYDDRRYLSKMCVYSNFPRVFVIRCAMYIYAQIMCIPCVNDATYFIVKTASSTHRKTTDAALQLSFIACYSNVRRNGKSAATSHTLPT